MTSVKLAHFDYVVCPDCGAPYSTFGREVSYNTVPGAIRRHCNGQTWEWILFTCGRRDMYIPNFEKIEVQMRCRNNDLAKAQEAARGLAVEQIVDFIAGLDSIDKEYREKLIGEVDYSALLKIRREEEFRKQREERRLSGMTDDYDHYGFVEEDDEDRD